MTEKPKRPSSLGRKLQKKLRPPAAGPLGGDKARIAVIVVAVFVLVFVVTMLHSLKRISESSIGPVLPGETRMEGIPGDERWDGLASRWPDAWTGYVADAEIDAGNADLGRLLDLLAKEDATRRVGEDTDALLTRLEKHQGSSIPAESRDAEAARLFWRHPEASRGKFFAVEGTVLAVAKRSVHLFVVKEKHTGQQVLFFTRGTPPAKRDQVRVSGVFLNLWVNRDGRFGANFASAGTP